MATLASAIHLRTLTKDSGIWLQSNRSLLVWQHQWPYCRLKRLGEELKIKEDGVHTILLPRLSIAQAIIRCTEI